jgi:hypothetical protein
MKIPLTVFAGNLDRTALIRLAISSLEDADTAIKENIQINKIFIIITLKKK